MANSTHARSPAFLAKENYQNGGVPAVNLTVTTALGVEAEGKSPMSGVLSAPPVFMPKQS